MKLASLKLYVACGLIATAMTQACGTPEAELPGSITKAGDDAQASGPARYGFDTPQLLSASALQTYKAALPKIAYPKLQRIFDDPGTFWYDHKVMPPSYQDSVAPDVTVGCRPNNEGSSLINIIPGGRAVFDEPGKTFSFPFGHTAGTDASQNIYVVDFMWLPVVDGQRLPVAYKIVNGSRGGIGLVQWRWLFPKGTVFGEMIYVKDGSGKLHPAELRTRERFGNAWATNAYRPFPTAATLSAAIKQRRPSYAASANLKRIVDHLDGDGQLTAKSRDSRIFAGVFQQSGAVDTLPEFGDEALVSELLTQTTFQSAFGETWKAAGGQKTFAVSAASSQFSIAPDHYEAGLIEVKDQSCQRCHKDAQRSIESFNSAAVLYGDVWGSDQIFSWHPFDPQLCHGAAEDNRALRPIFRSSGMVQRFDQSVHKPEYYKEISN